MISETKNFENKHKMNCKRCTKEITFEKYLFFGYYYCRECKQALESDSWFQEFVKDKRFVNIEN